MAVFGLKGVFGLSLGVPTTWAVNTAVICVKEDVRLIDCIGVFRTKKRSKMVNY